MRFKFLLLFILIILLFTSCNFKENIDETQISVINEDDYLTANIIEKKQSQVLFKETIAFSKAYPNANMLDLTDLIKPRADAGLSGVDDKGNIYYTAEKNDIEKTGAIYSYNPFKKEWKTLVETKENYNCAFIFANENYLLWMQDNNANWQKTSLHLLNLETLVDIEFYKHTLDPATGLTYAWQFSTPILIGNNIYFDDMVGKDKNELYKIKVFSYSISENKVTMLAEDAKWPMEYQKKAAWLKMSQDQKNSLFFSVHQNKNLIKTETRLGTAFTAGGDLIIANDYMSQAFYDSLSQALDSQSKFNDTVKDPAVSSYGIKLLFKNEVQPIIAVNAGFITNPVTNGDLVAWYGSSVGNPMLYSYNQDKLIQFDHLVEETVLGYNFYLSENYAILHFGYETEDSKQLEYFWKLQS
jgi:hypothetical protein